MTTLDLDVLARARGDGRIRIAADVRRGGAPVRNLWFEVDEEHEPDLVDRADPFVIATLLVAMRERATLRVNGAPVTTSLLRNLEEFQQVWHAWFALPLVDVTAESELEERSTAPAAVSFSGGVDSSFTLRGYAMAPRPHDRPLRSAVMIHGMDIPIEERGTFEGARKRVARMASSLGVPIIAVKTNAWTLQPPTHTHFPALGVASVLQALGGGHGCGVISSTATYRDPVTPLDSTPMTDRMLGSGAFEILHRGASHTRIQKMEALAGWDEALDHLRVCLEHPERDRNCGRCRKCLLTYVAFDAIGLRPRCFDHPPTDDAMTAWAARFSSNPVFVADMRAVIAAAEARGVRSAWLPAARRRLRLIDARAAITKVSPRLSGAAVRLYRRLR